MPLIEFVGCTASGKTTISRRVLACLTQSGTDAEFLDVGGRFRYDLITLPWFIKSIKHNPSLCKLAAKALMRDADSTIAKLNLFRNFAKKMGMYYLIRDRRSRRWIVWDEGIVHGAHNLFAHVTSEPNKPDIIDFAGSVPKPDLIVYVRAPFEKALAQALQRGHRRVKHPEKNMKPFVEHAYSVFETLISLKTIKPNLMIIDNNYGGPDEVDNISKEIVRNILRR